MPLHRPGRAHVFGEGRPHRRGLRDSDCHRPNCTLKLILARSALPPLACEPVNRERRAVVYQSQSLLMRSRSASAQYALRAASSSACFWWSS
jgi:hypothetical protein